MLNRRELARAAAKARTKIVKRKSLGGDKSEQGYAPVTKGTMINITGLEHDGALITASSFTQTCFFFFLAMVCLHLFTKNTAYRSANPLKQPKIASTVTEPEPVMDMDQMFGAMNATDATEEIIANATIE